MGLQETKFFHTSIPVRRTSVCTHAHTHTHTHTLTSTPTNPWLLSVGASELSRVKSRTRGVRVPGPSACRLHGSRGRAMPDEVKLLSCRRCRRSYPRAGHGWLRVAGATSLLCFSFVAFSGSGTGKFHQPVDRLHSSHWSISHLAYTPSWSDFLVLTQEGPLLSLLPPPTRLISVSTPHHPVHFCGRFPVLAPLLLLLVRTSLRLHSALQ